jgi:hypothetical protein
MMVMAAPCGHNHCKAAVAKPGGRTRSLMPVTTSKTAPVRVVGAIVIALGLVMMVSGIAAYATVGAQLSAERINISGDTPFLASLYGTKEGAQPKQVRSPLGAFSQAEVIKKHSVNMPENFGFPELNGKTAAQIAAIRSAKDYDTAKEDQMNALWSMMNTGSFLRTSLMVSALAFGVALLVIAAGLVSMLSGWGLMRLAKSQVADAEARLGGVQPAVSDGLAQLV